MDPLFILLLNIYIAQLACTCKRFFSVTPYKISKKEIKELIINRDTESCIRIWPRRANNVSLSWAYVECIKTNNIDLMRFFESNTKIDIYFIIQGVFDEYSSVNSRRPIFRLGDDRLDLDPAKPSVAHLIYRLTSCDNLADAKSKLKTRKFTKTREWLIHFSDAFKNFMNHD